jgi:hypothetical protein
MSMAAAVDIDDAPALAKLPRRWQYFTSGG